MVGKSLYFIPLGFHEIIITFILKYLVKIVKKNILKKSKKIRMLFQKIFWPILKGFFYMSSIEIFGKYILLTVIVSELVFESGEQNYIFEIFRFPFNYRFHLN